jgi:hypothetical protein
MSHHYCLPASADMQFPQFCPSVSISAVSYHRYPGGYPDGNCLNAQDQAPEILGFSIRVAFAQYVDSLQSQTKVPDIPPRSLRVSKYDLSSNLNAQTQDPDDSCPLHPHGVPREFGLTSSVFNQVLPRFYSKCHIHPSFPYVSHDHDHLLTCLCLKQSYVGIVRLEVFVRRLRIRIVSQGVSYVFLHLSLCPGLHLRHLFVVSCA